MKTLLRCIAVLGALVTVVLFTSSCANVERKAFTPPSHDALPEGPGLFTGEDGEINIISK